MFASEDLLLNITVCCLEVITSDSKKTSQRSPSQSRTDTSLDLATVEKNRSKSRWQPHDVLFTDRALYIFHNNGGFHLNIDINSIRGNSSSVTKSSYLHDRYGKQNLNLEANPYLYRASLDEYIQGTTSWTNHLT